MISLLVPCALIAVLGIPLMLELVPPNRLYGFRTPQTLTNRELWYRANRFAGYALFVAAAASGAVFLLFPQFASGRSWEGVLVLVAPLAIAVMSSLVYARRAAPFTTDFSVEFDSDHLPAVSMRYREPGRGEHTFDGELGAGKVVVSIYVPSPEDWDAALPWAAGRRREVLERLAHEVIRRKAAASSFTIHERWVHIEAR